MRAALCCKGDCLFPMVLPVCVSHVTRAAPTLESVLSRTGHAKNTSSCAAPAVAANAGNPQA